MYLLSSLALLTSTLAIGIIYSEHNQAKVKGLASLFADKENSNSIMLLML
jgi:hypothetical protein